MFSAESSADRALVDKMVLGFLAGGAVIFNSERVDVHWTDHLSLLMAHNARGLRKHLVIGVAGAPSTLGMLVVIRDTIFSMISRVQSGSRLDPSRPPEKILWLAPKGDMSQIFRRAIFKANNQPVPLREASHLVSLDLLEEHPSTTTVAFLRDAWRIQEALRSHAFASIVLDDPFGQVCSTPEATADILQRIFSEPNHPPVVAIVPVRALPETTTLRTQQPVLNWPWTAEVGSAVDPVGFAIQNQSMLQGTSIQRSQVVFEAASLLPASVVVCPPTQPVVAQAMAEVDALSARLAQEAYRSKNNADRRLVGEARAAVMALEALAIPVTIHEALTGSERHRQSPTITQRLEVVRQSLFNCSPAIRDDLSILLDRIADLMILMKTEVPKWNRLVDLLSEALNEGRRTAVAVPNRRVQEAMFKALQVQFPQHRDNLPWEIVTVSSIGRLAEVDELLFVGLPSVRQGWLLRYPSCTDRKLLVWPHHKNLGLWLAAPPRISSAEQLRCAAWAEVGTVDLTAQPDGAPRPLPPVQLLEGLQSAKAYYDIPIDTAVSSFVWNAAGSDDDEDDEDTGTDESVSISQPGRPMDEATISHHYVLHLEDGHLVYALEDDQLDVLKGTGKAQELVMAAAATLSVGQELLMIRGQSYIKLRNRLMENVDRRYNSIWFEEDWNRWREMCRSIPRTGKGFQKFYQSLCELGCDKDKQTVQAWLDGRIMAPLEVQDIRWMSLAAGHDLMFYFAPRLKNGMGDLRGRHSAFGKWLKKVILITRSVGDRDVFDDQVLDFTAKDLRDSVSRHRIQKIEVQQGRPPHRTGEVIKDGRNRP